LVYSGKSHFSLPLRGSAVPTYEYECRVCGHSFERTQSMSDDPVKDCPECGKDVRRVINGGAGIIFKGSGFYVNDSKGKSSTVSSSAKPGTQTADAPGGAAPAGNTPASNAPAGTASAGNAGKNPSAESGTKPARDQGNASASAPSSAGSRPESRAGAKESA
jgi:putative FmdB family regulatory protein